MRDHKSFGKKNYFIPGIFTVLLTEHWLFAWNESEHTVDKESNLLVEENSSELKTGNTSDFENNIFMFNW